MTQEEVAIELRVSKSTVLNWEKGKVSPKYAQFKMLCDIYDISEDYIFLP